MATPLRKGDPAPDFSGTTTDGKKVSLGDYRGKKLVTSAYRFPGRSGLYNLTLKNGAVRKLKAGSYVLEVAAGATKQTLGAATSSAFRVR